MTVQTASAAEMIAAQGPIGALTAKIDASSPLGPIENWSPTLISTVRLLLSSCAEIVLFWGPDLCALYNEQYAPTIGDKHPGALGQPARQGWAELWDDLEPLLCNVFETGETFHRKDRPFYIERHGGQGESVFFDVSFSPVFEVDGSIGGVLCIVSETTAKVLAERTMRTDRNRLWALARDPFLIADRNGLWLEASPAWSEILGWSQAELVGRTSDWMTHPDDISVTSQEVDQLSAGSATMRFENRFRTRGGDYRRFSWTAVPEGDLVYCVARDVTEQREHAQALAQTEAALRQAQKMETLGQLTGGVAHDFNNLLQIVIGNLDLLTQALPEDPPRLRRAADNAMAGARRAATLTQRLLAFARRQPLTPKRIDPAQLVVDMSDLFHRTLGEEIDVSTLSAETDSSIWPVEIDAHQLETALLNLAVNARDAMPYGGKLTIEMQNIVLDAQYAAQETDVAPGEYVLISVSDTGIGMDKATREKAIEPFFTTKEVGRGTGLGLSMVYGFIKQSGGHLRIYSEPEQGTSVKIYLPRSEGTIGAPHGVSPEQPFAAGRGETILVCEDDEQVRAYSSEALRSLGYRVVEAGTAREALDRLEDQMEGIVMLFTDVILPGGMTGADLAARVRERHPQLRILFTTGYARNAIVHHGRLDAGVELLPKPFTYADLAIRIRTMLDMEMPDPAD